MVDSVRYGPWAVIAGGSEGLGEAFARKLAASGINLVLVARRPEVLEALAPELQKSHGVEVRALALDLGSPDMLERIRSVTDDVEVGLLVYNAATTGGMKSFIDLRMDKAMAAVDVNVVGLMKLTHHFGAAMARRGRGGIVVLGSMAGNAGAARLGIYGGTKAFQQIFVEALWAEMRPLGVDVLIQVVGAADTPNRRRSGAADDIEGFPVLPPEAYAQQALDELPGGGPVITAPQMKQMFYRLCGMDRREVAEMMLATVSGKAGN
jgi:short-subunit dehydrogenase